GCSRAGCVQRRVCIPWGVVSGSRKRASGRNAMGKLLYSASMSVDGFISGAGGDMSWLTPYLEPNPEVDAIVSEIGALLIGRTSFDGDDPHRGDPESEGKAFGGGWEGPQF